MTILQCLRLGADLQTLALCDVSKLSNLAMLNFLLRKIAMILVTTSGEMK